MNQSTLSNQAPSNQAPATAYQRSQERERFDEPLRPVGDLACYIKEYARRKPGVVALTCLGIGFFLGWKLKPW